MRLVNIDDVNDLFGISDRDIYAKETIEDAICSGQLEVVDAVPVVHGRWIYHIDDLFPAESTQECDQCHEEQSLTCDDDFCPHCGARMDGKDGDHHD